MEIEEKLNILKSFMQNSYDDAKNIEPNAARSILSDIKYLNGIISELANEEQQHLPNGFKIYKCTDCQTINVKFDNGEVRVGFCDNCEHPVWN